jgi:AraC-like DNA-binding protein
LPNRHHDHPRPWHRGSEFGDGLRWPLDRERRAVWKARLDLARRAGRITALHEKIGLALLRRLGTDGRCDPAHDTIAADVGCGSRTVRTALARLFELGLLKWINRLVRVGDRVEQTSNAYMLIVAAVAAGAGYVQGSVLEVVPAPATSGCGEVSLSRTSALTATPQNCGASGVAIRAFEGMA